MPMKNCIVSLCFLCAGSIADAQWNPHAGQWGKTDARDVRVMTWNAQDSLCTTQPKVEGLNAWCALARIVAVVKPDVLVMQECGDNSGNGTGAGVDSIAGLTSVFNLFVNGGTDTFLGNVPVTSYVRLYAPSLSYPFIYVSDQHDGFNRNVLLSRYPFTDLTGDTRTIVSNYTTIADLYVPTTSNAGIRGFIFAELDLPGADYRGNLVVGTAHFKSGGNASDFSDRLIAGQRAAYYVDYLYNGGGTATPDPRAKILDSPAATLTLDPYTPAIWGGDFNEDEATNGRDGPVLWMTRAQASGDGTDRDRSDSSFDDARDPLNTNNSTNADTQGSGKLDYMCWQDSIATLRRAFIFNAGSLSGHTPPPEIVGFPTVALASALASDHRPVIADFVLPAPPPPVPGPFSLSSPADASIGVPLTAPLAWTASADAATYTVRVANNPGLVGGVTIPGVVATSAQVPAGFANPCTIYYWGVTAVNANGSTPSTPGVRSFETLRPADFNRDGTVDFFDYDDFVVCFENTACAAADFNADGSVDFFDYDDFVIAFDAGC